MNFLGNSTLKSKYKSVLNVREHDYCNRSKTLQGMYNFSHTRTRPTTIPMAKDKC